MRSSRKRKADELSAIKPSLRNFRFKKSNTVSDINSINNSNSVKINEFLQEFKIVIDKTIVNQYLDGKGSLRNRLELIPNVSSTTYRSEKNENHTNNLEWFASMDSVESHEKSTSIIVKIETDANTNNDSCANDNSVFDSSIIKQELPDEMASIESPCVSDSNTLTFNHAVSTEDQSNNTLIKDEDGFSHTIESIKIENIDSIIDCNYVSDDDLTVGEEFKSEDLVLDDRGSDNEREPETYFENQSNSTSINQNTVKESITNKHHYSCDNCDFKTVSKTIIKRHIFHNHFNKDGFLPCNKCNQKFKTDKILNLHRKVCGTKLYYTCKFCPKTLNKSFFIRRHIISQHLDQFKMEELDRIMQEIINAKVRKDENEMAEILKKIAVTKRRARSIFDRNKYIKMFCSKCNVVSERGKAVRTMDCCNCGTTLLFQCQMCDKSSDKICTMRSHVKWSCESAETKLIGNNTVLPNLVHEKKIIVHTKLNRLLDEIGQSEESELSNYECKECIKKNFNICKHIEYKRAGCHYEKGLAICPKCNAKFRLLKRCVEHHIFCGVQFRYACPFCYYTSKLSDDVKRHLKCMHIGKFDMEKFQDIFDEVKNERTRVKEKYKADYISSKMLKIKESDQTDS